MNDAFRGTAALIRCRLRATLGVVAAAGVLPGILLGTGAPIFAPDVLDGLIVALSPAIFVIAFAAPLIGTVAESAARGDGGRSRREELFALPIGRLAIPTAVLANGAIALVGTVASFLLIVGLTAGLPAWPSAPPAAFELPLTSFAQLVVAGAVSALALFATAFAIATIGAHPACHCLWLSITPIVPLALAGRMGYSPAERVDACTLWLAVLAAYYLAVPFALHARPTHHWAVVKGELGGPDLAAAFTFIAAALALGVLGLGVALVAILAGGAALVAAAARRRPPVERRRVPHLRVALALFALVAAAPAAWSLSADAARVAEAARVAPGRVIAFSVAPGGRFVAALVCDERETTSRSNTPGLQRALIGRRTRGPIARVVVTDLAVADPAPIVLPGRFCALADGCWSEDGRFLAVADEAIGRVRVETQIAARARDALHKGGFGRALARRGASTFILDTRTGDVDRRALLELAPGWRRPEDLVRVAFAVGGFTVADGHGRSVFVPGLGVPRVLGYREGAPIILDGNTGQRLRLVGDALRVEPSPYAPITEPVPADDMAWRDAERWVISDASGLTTIRRADGARRRLLDEPARLVAPIGSSPPDAAPARLVALSPDERRAWEVDLANGTAAPLDLPEGFVPSVIEGARIFGLTAAGELAVLEGAERRLRPVFATPSPFRLRR